MVGSPKNEFEVQEMFFKRRGIEQLLISLQMKSTQFEIIQSGENKPVRVKNVGLEIETSILNKKCYNDIDKKTLLERIISLFVK